MSQKHGFSRKNVYIKWTCEGFAMIDCQKGDIIFKDTLIVCSQLWTYFDMKRNVSNVLIG